MSDHRFHSLTVAAVERETADAVSIVLAVPDALATTYAYKAGQFLTFRVDVDGQTLLRSYSMSSSPHEGELRVTVKRVPGGAVSNWINDHWSAGTEVEATPPAGVFCLGGGDADVLALAAGSGITPVFSIIKTALTTTGRRVRLLYANRDRDSVIFAAELDELAATFPTRLEVVHRYDTEHGFVDEAAVRAFAGDGGESFVCGPGPFMDIAEAALGGVDHIERFAATPAPVSDGPADGCRVTIELDGRVETVDHRAGTTILQTARQMGLQPPFSCEAGSCATCMARVVEGSATMFVNDALTEDEVRDGWVLTCQAVPASSTVRVFYDPEGP